MEHSFYFTSCYVSDYELESIKALFNEKEKELAMAVTKVDEMTRQLEEIRSGRVKSSTNTQSPAALAELEKLKKELVVRTMAPSRVSLCTEF